MSNVIDNLVERYGVKNSEYTVTLPGGETFRFKAIVSYDELCQIGKASGKFVRLCRSETCPAPWAPYIPETDDVLLAVYGMSATCLETGDNELTQFGLLQLAAKAGFLFNAMRSAWEAQQGLQAIELDAIDEAKND